MTKNLVSIIMPYYKKRNFFYKSFFSAYNQTYKNFEIIIIYDDKSKKDLKFIKKIILNRKKVKLLINNKQQGVGPARNLGIKKSKGKFLAFLDCDDLWHKKKLEIQIKYMLKNRIKLCFTSYNVIDEKDHFLDKRKCQKKICFHDLKYACDIGLSTVVIDRQFFKKKIFFPNLKTKEDYVLWLKLSKSNNCFYGINKTLTYWRKTTNSLSSSTFQKLKDGFNVYNKYMKYNYFKSFLHLIYLSLNYLKKTKNWFV